MYNLLEKSCLYIIDTLYHQSVFCIILFILVFGLSRFFKGKSPHWLLGLWFLILFRLILPTDFSFTFSARNLADGFLSAHNVNTSLEEVSDRLSVKYGPNLTFDSTLSIETSGEDRLGAQVPLEVVKDKDISLPLPVKLSIVWLFGVMIFLMIFVAKIRNIRRVLKHSKLVQNEKTIAVVDSWRQSFSITRPVTLYSSNSFLSPFTTGLLRPKIFIPESFLENMDKETINSIIAHEMVHIKNFDHAWVRFQNVLQILYFFHPFVWYANSQINIERDRLCDSEVLAKHIIPPKAFGKSVIDVLKFNLSGYRVVEPQLCFINHKNIYEYRIRDILRGKTISKTKSFSIFLLICLLGLFLLPMSKANIETKKPEISEEILTRDIELGEADTESDAILAEVPDADNLHLYGTNIAKDENAGQKVENGNIFTQSAAKKDEKNNEPLMLDSIKGRADASEKQTGQTAEKEIRFSSSPTEKIVRNEIPVKADSNQEKIYFPVNRNQKNNETISGQNTKAYEPVKQDQIHSVDYFSRGISYLRNGEVEDAISDLNKAIELNPENAVAYYSRGKARYKKGQIQRALSDYNRAIELNSDYTDVYISRGYYYQTIGDYKKAISDYNKVISIRPRNAHAYNYRGSAYFIQEEYRKAFADFNKAIELNPEFAAAYQNRGSVYYRMDKKRKAISDYNKSIELNPKLAASYQDRGSIYFNQDRFDKAISDYSKALRLEPEDPLLYNNRGIAYFAHKEYQKAFNDFNKVIEINPVYPDAYIYRGYYHQTMRDYSKAVADYNKALTLDPGIGVAKKLLREAAKILARRGSETIDTDYDQETVGLWVEKKGRAKRKELGPDQEQAGLRKSING